jgi:hypothetical protein
MMSKKSEKSYENDHMFQAREKLQPVPKKVAVKERIGECMRSTSSYLTTHQPDLIPSQT